MIKKINTTQNWLPIDKIFSNGIILYKNKYFKILKIIPINYDLKSNLEKEAILNSYKLFLKSCDFDIQILIQSKKEDLSNYFFYLHKISENENNEKIKEITTNYISFIKRKVDDNKSSSKNFYIIVKYDIETNEKQINEEKEEIDFNYLSDCFFKIKESLSRCGNIIYDVCSQKECIEVLTSFLVPKNESKEYKEELI